jgi:hypothetical protein
MVDEPSGVAIPRRVEAVAGRLEDKAFTVYPARLVGKCSIRFCLISEGWRNLLANILRDNRNV